MNSHYDAILIVAFGGPEQPDDVMPFLENVLRGRNVPQERMMAVAEHYRGFGGKSPINDQCRELIAALRDELDRNKIDLPIYWGNRNWHPMLADTLREMRDDGINKALVFLTSAYSSYSSCRQYLENIQAAQREVGDSAPQIGKICAYCTHPGFIETWIDRVRTAFEQLPDAQLIFTAHSIPSSMAENCDYEKQLREACALIAQALSHPDWELVFQSRSGPPMQPWLEPDVCDVLEKTDARNIVLAPIGFISDHMEVVYDLDTEAREVCDRRSIKMVRAATPGTHPRFIAMIRELIEEHIDPKSAIHPCPANCCPPPGRPK
jgi:ferrochelatase